MRLARDGYHVFATVRRSSDGREQSAHGLVTPLVMDVAKPDEIAAAAEALAGHVGDRGLDLLVNNAGVGVFLPMELVSMERFRHQLDVNVTGQVAVTQAFLPMIRQATGRILMMGSVADRITMPFAGPQAAAKSALAALTEAFGSNWPRGASASFSSNLPASAPMRSANSSVTRQWRSTGSGQWGAGGMRRPSGRRGACTGAGGGRKRPRCRCGDGRPCGALPTPQSALSDGSAVVGARCRRHVPTSGLDPIRRRIFSLPKPGSAETARDSR